MVKRQRAKTEAEEASSIEKTTKETSFIQPVRCEAGPPGLNRKFIEQFQREVPKENFIRKLKLKYGATNRSWGVVLGGLRICRGMALQWLERNTPKAINLPSGTSSTSIKPVAAKPRERLDGIQSTSGGLDSDSKGHRSDSKDKSIEGIIAFGSARQ